MHRWIHIQVATNSRHSYTYHYNLSHTNIYTEMYTCIFLMWTQFQDQEDTEIFNSYWTMSTLGNPDVWTISEKQNKRMWAGIISS